jgi:hypothetical protein
MYYKERESFFKDGIQDPSPVETVRLSQSPSRYLKALLKHEPNRRQAAIVLYLEAFSEDESTSASESDEDLTEDDCPLTGPNEEKRAILLRDLINPLRVLARLTRRRYAY